MVWAGIPGSKSIIHNHVRPLTIHIDIIGIVKHVGRQPSGWTHIHLQRYDLVITVGAKEFEMKETFAHIECFEYFTAGLLQVVWNLPEGKIINITILIHSFHYSPAVLHR